MKTMRILLALFLISLIVFPGCHRSASKKQLASGIEGQVLLGPLSPKVSSENPVTDRPYKATLNILNLEREQIARIQTDKEGKFKLALEPGEYIISPVAPNPFNPPYPEEQQVTVKPNEYTSVVVRFDSGIR